MKKKPIVVGFDFDGVVAYNPARLARLPVTFVKKKIFGTKGTKFFIPSTPSQKFIWALLHESSIFPAKGIGLLKELVSTGVIEAHLVTARYSFLQKSLYAWLHRYKITDIFTSITINEHDEQPHLYKTKIIQAKKFDYFVEDNLDIVTHLAKHQQKTTVLWIYNLFDRLHPYQHKFPHLEKALQGIMDGSYK